MDDALLAAIRESVVRTDNLRVQQIAELEHTIAGLHEALRVLAAACLQLRALPPLREAADAALVEGIVRRADSVLAYLEPPRH